MELLASMGYGLYFERWIDFMNVLNLSPFVLYIGISDPAGNNAYGF